MKNREHPVRLFSAYAEQRPEVKGLLEKLAHGIDTDEYRKVMRQLGDHLASSFSSRLRSSKAQICLVCTVEDADFLASGVLARLEGEGFGDRIHLLCLWNEKVREGLVSLSPVKHQYLEPLDKGETIFVVVKSIISGACVVKTNLTRALSLAKPKNVFVVSPVLLDGAEERLEHEFPRQIAKSFEYVWFATDFKKDGDNVIPGIGGSVYELLGLGDESSKNSYLPALVKQRRALRHQAATPALV